MMGNATQWNSGKMAGATLLLGFVSFQDNLKSKLRHAVLLSCARVYKNGGKFSRFPEHH